MTTSKLSFYGEVQFVGKYRGTPTNERTRNDLDIHGQLLDLRRLPQEGNYSYYKRLMSVNPLRGGADQKGLIHGITRDLGLEEKTALQIIPVSLGDRWAASAPMVEVNATKVIIYSEYWSDEDYTIDTEIDIFNHGSGYLLEDVLLQIQGSQYFTAELGPQIDSSEKSNGLIPGISSRLIEREWVPSGTHFFLEHRDILPGTLAFTEKRVFATEVSPSVADITPGAVSFSGAVISPVTRAGDYYVDYAKGSVISYSTPSGAGLCRYIYRSFPYYVRWSPIVVYSLRDSVYREKVFETETMLDNSEKAGLVTAEGKTVYDQVFQKSSCLWGE